tara:strand:+ start:1406 stop:2677 length:1272 start_codon:yes stop_codon:yes gene_type:complete
MATELKMPQMGYDMEEGTVVRWLKKEGAHVNRNEAVAEIETDKAVVEFESESEGILLSIVAKEGSIVPVGETIAVIGTQGEEVEETPITVNNEAEPEQDDIEEPSPQLEQTPEVSERARILATPVARRLADESGIDLRTVQGSGPGGRITKGDIENLSPSRGIVENDSQEVQETVAQESPESKNEPIELTSAAILSTNKQPLSRMRQQIARVTVKSKTEKPHFYVSADIDMTKSMDLRRQVNEQLADQGVRITVNDLIVKACIESLKKYPKFNAYYEEDGIQYNETVNIAVAIAEEEGLIVPAILDCAGKSLRQVSVMIKDLAERSSNGTLSTQEYTGGTFAISNLGMYDVTSFVAIIHPPQSAVLAVGTVSEKPTVQNGEVSISQIMTATLSADHRIVDGAEGAEFLIQVKKLLENPMGLVV